MYYHSCAYLLNDKGKLWDGERMLINYISLLSSNDNDLYILLVNMKYVKKLKDASFLEFENCSKKEIVYVKKIYDDSLNNNYIKGHLNTDRFA